jgi:hypothetical protein
MKFPLYSIDGHMLTSLKGEKSHAYRYDPKDIEQMDSSSISGYINGLKSNLINLEANKFLKFYSLESGTYLNSQIELNSLTSIELQNMHNPVLANNRILSIRILKSNK